MSLRGQTVLLFQVPRALLELPSLLSGQLACSEQPPRECEDEEVALLALKRRRGSFTWPETGPRLPPHGRHRGAQVEAGGRTMLASHPTGGQLGGMARGVLAGRGRGWRPSHSCLSRSPRPEDSSMQP